MVHVTRSRVAISGSIIAIFTIVRVVFDQSAISALQRQADDVTHIPGENTNHKPPNGAPPSPPSLILILGYMRGGTSFVGDLFNQHQGAFYWYEPLDGVYSALFGTPYGWTPLDITHTLDGEPRRLSNTEEEAVVDALGAIYTCQFHKLPTEVLTHRFVDGTLSYAHAEYTGCLYYMENNYPRKSSDECKSFLQSLCPQSFEDPRTYKCYEFLHKGLPNVTDGDVGNSTGEDAVFNDVHIERFHEHSKCLWMVRKNAASCLSALTQKCQKSTAIAVKTIRMRMSTVELVLRRFPALRVVHVFRDPVPIVLSRYRNKLMSAASGGMVITEAVVTCSKMADDIRRRHVLEDKFSRRNFMELHLSEFAVEPLRVLEMVFRHTIDGPRPLDTSMWVKELYKNGGDQFVPCSNFTSGDEERDEFTMEYCYEGFLQNLKKACVEYYSTVNATWR